MSTWIGQENLRIINGTEFLSNQIYIENKKHGQLQKHNILLQDVNSILIFWLLFPQIPFHLRRLHKLTSPDLNKGYDPTNSIGKCSDNLITDRVRFATPMGNVNANRRNPLENHSGVTTKHKSFLLNSHCVYVAVEKTLY